MDHLSEDYDLKALLISLLSEETERDQQRLVGASNLSNPCTRCLAQDMAGEPQERGDYYLGAVIGTAIHGLLEERASKREGLRAEMRVVVGEIPGYGIIKSTTDLYDEANEAVDDWKTTTREKLKTYKTVPRLPPSDLDTDLMLKARWTMKQYNVQTNLYAKGVEDMGFPVRSVNIGFIARDAKTEADVWAFSQPYDRRVAERALDRATKIWQALEQGKKPESFKSHDHCYPCSVRNREVI